MRPVHAQVTTCVACSPLLPGRVADRYEDVELAGGTRRAERVHPERQPSIALLLLADTAAAQCHSVCGLLRAILAEVQGPKVSVHVQRCADVGAPIRAEEGRHRHDD